MLDINMNLLRKIDLETLLNRPEKRMASIGGGSSQQPVATTA